MTGQAPWWCCNGFAAECPLCAEYGTRVSDHCPGHPQTIPNGQIIGTARAHAL